MMNWIRNKILTWLFDGDADYIKDTLHIAIDCHRLCEKSVESQREILMMCGRYSDLIDNLAVAASKAVDIESFRRSFLDLMIEFNKQETEADEEPEQE